MDPISTTIFAGNAHPALARDIAYHLNLPLGRITVGRFSDGEISVEIMENVRGRDVFIVQPTCPPVNENLMELLIIADACQRASASRITAVIPYFGYGRQDRRRRAARVPITAKLVANLIAQSGIDRVLTVDVHADQIQGFFDIPVDNVYASPVLLGDAWKQKYKDMVVVSPDVGGVERARALAKRLDDAGLAIIDKRRPQPNMAEVMNVIGEVANKTCVLIDDMVDTAGTLCQAAAVLKQRGADPRRRLHHAPRALRPRRAADPDVHARRDRRDRHDPAERRGAGLPEDPPAQRRRAAGRDPAPDQRSRVRQLPLPRLAQQAANAPPDGPRCPSRALLAAGARPGTR